MFRYTLVNINVPKRGSWPGPAAGLLYGGVTILYGVQGEGGAPIDMTVDTQAPEHEFSFDQLQGRDWEDTLERFTEDMDPWAIDIVELADRYKSYLDRMDRLELEIPGRMAVVCATLLRMKTHVMRGLDEDEPEPREEEFLDEEIDDGHDEWMDEIKIPEKTIEPPVKNRPQRRVSLDELKDALDRAMDIQERRQERQEVRREEEQDFLDIEAKDIQEKLDGLMDRLQTFFSGSSDGVRFEEVLERRDREERIDTFIQILHLETDDEIRCKQEEFFGDIEIYPGENT
jgi:chromatin segregation and condensation protein Rec8/ScpA/Scc1 (kleisin family)